MSSIKFLIIFLFLLSISSICFGQQFIEDENWLLKLGGDYTNYSRITYEFKSFSFEDVTEAKKRLSLIQKVSPKDEWEGIYYTNTGIGDSKMIWSSEAGFFSFYFYHYLKSLDYGKVYDSHSFIKLASEKTSNNNKQKFTKTNLIKVLIGERHFLVPENRLQDFCDRAAGLSIDLDDFYYYWTKDEDMQKETSGLPVLAYQYKRFLRSPIDTEIIRIGKRKIVQSNSIPTSDEIHYSVTLSVGRNKNIKRRMNFFVDELGEWVEIKSVFQLTSVGFIRRDFDENKREQCFDSEGGTGQIIPCKEIKIGMNAKTKGSL